MTGDLYLGDSGDSYQEIDYQPAGSSGGLNYGWPIMDGPAAFEVPAGFNLATLTLPAASYAVSQGYAARAGFVYRGPTEPRMVGIFFYGDRYSRYVWELKQVGTNWQSQQLAPTAFGIAAFGEDDQSNLYLADGASGGIFEIQDSYQVLPPSFSFASGTIYSNLVGVRCPTPGVAIHYTTNGFDPTESDPIIASGDAVEVFTGITNNIRAFRADLSPSIVVSSVYTLQVATPVFTPQSPITNGTSVSISCATPGAVIYYTLDGTTPTTNSLVYSSPFLLNAGVTLSAVAFADGYLASATETVHYVLTPVGTPVFNPPQGLVPYAPGVTISCATPGAVIYYTLDGTTPTTNSPIYINPVVLPSRGTLEAQAYRSDLAPSAVQAASYTLFDFEHTVVTTLAGGPTGGLQNGRGLAAEFSSPQGLCIDQSGNLFVADSGNNVIRKISPSGQVTTFAGTGVAGSQLGATTNAQFSGPTSVAIDRAGNIYVADAGNCNRICKIATNGMVSEVAGLGCPSGQSLWQIASDPGGNIYAGSGLALMEATTGGSATQVAGVFPSAPSDSECEFGWCFGVGVGIDTTTNLYITTAALIYKYPPGGPLTLFAGSPTSSYGSPNAGYSDGPSLLALFGNPQLVIFAIPARYNDAFVDFANNVFVSDSTRIRKISPGGWVSTLAGAGPSGYQNGMGSVAQFNGVTQLCSDTNGNVYVADANNNCIRKISLDTYGIGIPDWWQLEHFGYVGIDPNADPDHDGMSNFAEFLAGTDPNDPNSSLRITSIQAQPGGILLGWTGGTNAFEYLQRCTGLAESNAWQDIFTNSRAASPNSSYLDASATNGPYFYRIRVGWQ